MASVCCFGKDKFADILYVSQCQQITWKKYELFQLTSTACIAKPWYNLLLCDADSPRCPKTKIKNTLLHEKDMFLHYDGHEYCIVFTLVSFTLLCCRTYSLQYWKCGSNYSAWLFKEIIFLYCIWQYIFVICVMLKV